MGTPDTIEFNSAYFVFRRILTTEYSYYYAFEGSTIFIIFLVRKSFIHKSASLQDVQLSLSSIERKAFSTSSEFRIRALVVIRVLTAELR